MFQQATKRTLADEVITAVRTAILEGRLRPGEQLREEALAEMFGVSRGPIREALWQLEREGLVLFKRNRRAYVARLSREDLEEVASLRLALELLAVRLVVRHAGEEVLDELQQIVDAMIAESQTDLTQPGAAEMDIRFHEALVRAARHQRLYRCWSDLSFQIRIVMLSRNLADPGFRFTITGHQAVLDAIRARDEEQAVAVMQAHLQGTYQRLVKTYDKVDNNGQ